MSKRYLLSTALATLIITISAFFFDAVGLISYGLIIASVWGAIAILAVWLIAWILSRLRITKKHFRLQTPLKFPLLLFITGSVGVLVMNLYAPPALPDLTFHPSEQLSYMYETDQGNRLALRFLKLNERDQERRQRVLEFHTRGAITSPEQMCQAATILQHGAESEHYELAYLLAKQASEMGYKEADGLWKAAYDRWMLSLVNHKSMERNPPQPLQFLASRLSRNEDT